jgi:hypothetical protein
MNFPNEFEWRTFNELPIGGAYGIFMSCSGLAGIFMRIFGFTAGMPVSCGLIIVQPYADTAHLEPDISVLIHSRRHSLAVFLSAGKETIIPYRNRMIGSDPV